MMTIFKLHNNYLSYVANTTIAMLVCIGTKKIFNDFLLPNVIFDLCMNSLIWKKTSYFHFDFSFAKTQDTLFQCSPWEEYSFGPYLLQNNTWGQGDIIDFSQCIFTTSDSIFGWNWDWPNIGNNVKAYPEIIFGKKPWSSSSTNNILPIS